MTTEKISKVIRITLIYFVMIVICGVLAPFIAWSLDLLGGVFPGIEPYIHFKFRRIVSRCVMIATLFFVAVLVKNSRVQPLQFFNQMGLHFSAADMGYFVKGLIISSFFVFGIIACELLIGVRQIYLNTTAWGLVRAGCYALLAGTVIGLIEEVFFRGIIFRLLIRYSALGAFIFSAAFYAAVHFLAKGDVAIGNPPAMFDGFRVMGGFLMNFAHPLQILPAFIGLLLFGFILNHAYMRTGSLLFCMGIHAGAVFVIKTEGFWNRFVGNPSPLIFGDKWIYNGLVGWIFLMAMWIYVVWTAKGSPCRQSMVLK